jgi:hypothetical protein
MRSCCPFLLLALVLLPWLAPLPAQAVSSGSTLAFFSGSTSHLVEDSRTGLGVTSQI